MNANDTIAAPAASLNAASTAAVSDSPVNVDTIDQRLAAIEVEKTRLAALEEERARLLREKEVALAAKRRDVIATIPALLGVTTVMEAIALMRGSVAPVSGARKPVPPGTAIPESTKAQARQMLEAHTPVAKVAKHLRISEATLWKWKRLWGMTHQTAAQKRSRAAKVKAAPKAKTPKGKTATIHRFSTQPGALPVEKQEALLARIKEGKTPITKLAKEFGRTRAAVYQFAHKHGVATPGILQHAA